MASEEKKARDRAIRQVKLFESRGAGPSLAETDAFRCGKCGKRKCTYYQMQVRIAYSSMADKQDLVGFYLTSSNIIDT